MNKKLIKILSILMLVSFLTACSPEISEETIGPDIENTSYPISITDYLGRQVTIKEPVEKVACGYAYAGHVMALLNRGEDITAVVGGLQRDKIMTDLYPHIKNLPVPFSSGSINIEEILKNTPDLVFVKPDTALNQAEISKLEKFNIPYIAVDFNSIEEQLESIELISKALDEEEKGKSYIDYYKNVLAYIENKSKNIKDQDIKTVYHSVNEAVRTYSEESLSVDWLRRIKARNVSKDQDLREDGSKAYASLEQIYLWDPDIIFANEYGVPNYILTNEKWKGLRAVKNKEVYQLPIGLSRWGHHGSLETPLAMLYASKILYPDYYEDLDMVEETKSYYRDFYGLELTNEEVEDIFMGNSMRLNKDN